jgi:hypothetical protein
MHLRNKKSKYRQKLHIVVNPWKYRQRKQQSKTKIKVRSNQKYVNRPKKITTTMSSFRENLVLSDPKNSQFVQYHRAHSEETVATKFILVCSKIKKKAKEIKM